MKYRCAHWLFVLALLGLLGLLPEQARAQVFSPGELHRYHADMEGLSNCKKCHSTREKVAPSACLSCHTPLKARVQAKKGYHAAVARQTDCGHCHPDHKGKNAEMVIWPEGSQERFPHQEAGWQLKASHGKLACEKCHQTRRVTDPAVVTYLQKHPGTRTFLGLSQTCKDCHFDEHRGSEDKDCSKCHDEDKWKKAPAFKHDSFYVLKGSHKKVDCQKCHPQLKDPAFNASAYPTPRAATYLKFKPIKSDLCTDCHFDEHRGNEGKDCRKCHDEDSWKKAPLFKHDKYYALKGAHTKVECLKCHPQVRDPAYNPNARPAPRAPSYLKFKPVKHELCTDCHTDPHRNRFGDNCLSCHSQDTWSVKAVKDAIAFHDKTTFPLEGRHQTVPCERCHPTQKDGTKLLKPIPHDRCGNCHPNAHPDLPEAGQASQDCKTCHSTNGYLPARYGLEQHGKTRYPLTAAHTAVACTECHLKKLGTPIAASKAEVAPKGFLSSRVLSPWRMRNSDVDLKRCASCHATPHRDQFGTQDCAECHKAETWKVQGFDHARTRYPLEGKHSGVACSLCHTLDEDKAGSFTRYKPVNTTDCAPCHADVHYGQLRRLTPSMPCSTCHTVQGFDNKTFQHNDPRFSDFPLKGKHEKTECSSCHPKVTLAPGAQASRYRPTPTVCEACHDDIHKGAYAQAGQLLDAEGKRLGQPGVKTASGAEGAAWQLPSSYLNHTQGDPTSCGVCHQESSWQRVSFSHDRTGFPLRGQHKPVACVGCHKDTLEAKLPTGCADCHRDPHLGELGSRCEECHSENGFEQIVAPLALHVRAGFPLLGRHALAPCTECHRDQRNLGFTGVPEDCAACHATEVPPSSSSVPDHLSFSSDCGICHTPTTWGAANYLEHDRCFPINPLRHHTGIACDTCHRNGLPTPGGGCVDSGVSCTSCHGCQEGRHGGVSGYECKDRKCYQCHPGG